MELTSKTNENLLFKLIDNADVMFLYLDTAGKVTLCNKKVEDITAFKKEDILGKNWDKALYHNTSSNIQLQMFKAMVESLGRVPHCSGTLI